MEKHNGYFEGILQLRNPSKEVLDFVWKLVEERNGVSITKAQRMPNGVDLYLTSQKFLQTLGKKLKSNFHGELKISSKLFTKNRITSKNVYRVNVLFKLARIKKGDVIQTKKGKLKIVGLGKKIFAKDLETGKKVTLNFKEIS